MWRQAARQLVRRQGRQPPAAALQLLEARGGGAATSSRWVASPGGSAGPAERRQAYTTQDGPEEPSELATRADDDGSAEQPRPPPMPIAGFKLPDFAREPSRTEALLGGPGAAAAAEAAAGAGQGGYGRVASEAISRLASQRGPAPEHLALFGEPSEEQLDRALERWAALLDAGDLAGALSVLQRQLGLDASELLAPSEHTRGKAKDARQARTQREGAAAEGAALQRQRLVDAFGRAYATGKRKTSIARVWLREPSEARKGLGNILVNGRPLDEHFKPILARLDVIAPFDVTDSIGKFDVKATVRGGGVTGQAQAVRHGIAKALQLWDPELRPPLKAAGFLTRDSRIVERKKPGKAKARKSFQWVKR